MLIKILFCFKEILVKSHITKVSSITTYFSTSLTYYYIIFLSIYTNINYDNQK